MFKNLFFIIICAVVLLVPKAYAQSNDVAGVTAAAEKLRTLMLKPDKNALSALIYDELSYGHSSGKIDTKTSFIADLLSGASAFTSIDISEQTVKTVGDNAIIRHTFSAKTNNKGAQPGEVKLKILTVWKKQGTEWKLLARQAIKF